MTAPIDTGDVFRAPRGRRRPLRRLLRPALAAASLAALTASPAAASRKAHTSGTVTLNDSGSLRLTSHKGITLNEQGNASGTVRGTIYIHLHLTSTNHVTAEVNFYPSGGSITGYASASYRVAGARATFSGTMSVARGTGRYAHAHGTGLSFTGSVQRTNDAVSVRVNGSFST